MAYFLRFASETSLLCRNNNTLQQFKHIFDNYQLINKSKLLNGQRTLATSTRALDDTKIKKFDEDYDIDLLVKLKMKIDKLEQSGCVVPIHKKALIYGNKIAIKDQCGEYTYYQLYDGAKRLGAQISDFCATGSSERVAFLCSNSAVYTMIQWGIWFSGQIAVPLSYRHPPDLLKYFIEDSQANLLITTPDYESIIKPLANQLNKNIIIVDHTFIPDVDKMRPKSENIVEKRDNITVDGSMTSEFYTKSNAMILYTSGTTGKPKGVVLSHKNISSQMKSLTDAWNFNGKDCLLHVLPLNHIHGCVNALMCPLNVGGKVVMHQQFDSHNVWSTLLAINTPAKDRVNIFMGVPTMYNLLIDEYDKIFSKDIQMIEYIRNHCMKNIRLMISGSAPLPTTTFNKWLDLSGHRLLERYGMTEIGMALSNPYFVDKVRSRQPGTVGLPLPDVEVRIVDNDSKVLHTSRGESGSGFWFTSTLPVYKKMTNINPPEPIVGELQVKGPNVFKEYWKRPEETKNEFDNNYFKTGDVACFENGTFKILGRKSVDIIKSGGYKISALEIETCLLTHPSIKDVAVIGIPDITWGEQIVAIVVLRNDTELSLDDLKEFSKDNLPEYSIPNRIELIEKLPRNAMGKINKKDLQKIFTNN